MIQRRRRTKKHGMPEISLTPLIDTALVLLVIFMVATPIMKNSLNIDLPKGRMKDDKAATAAPVVSLSAKGQLCLNDEAMQLDALVTKLAELVKRTKEGKVYIHCDVKASSGSLVQVIDTIKYVAGVENVVLSTDMA